MLLCALAGAVLGYANYRETSGMLPITFQLENGDETERFYVDISSTPSTRKKGLMFRKSMGADRGMIFIFRKEEQRGFWMKNTYISLDMIFVSEDLDVIGVVADTPTLSEDRQSVRGDSKYVVEFIAGTAEKYGIKKGAKLKLHGETPKPL